MRHSPLNEQESLQQERESQYSSYCCMEGGKVKLCKSMLYCSNHVRQNTKLITKIIVHRRYARKLKTSHQNKRTVKPKKKRKQNNYWLKCDRTYC